MGLLYFYLFGRLLISDILKSMLCGRKSILSWFSWRIMGKPRKTDSVDGLRTEFRIVGLKNWLPFRPRNAVAYRSELQVWERPPPPISSSFYCSFFSSLLPIAPVQWPELILGIQKVLHVIHDLAPSIFTGVYYGFSQLVARRLWVVY
jgi:hypothetical protein